MNKKNILIILFFGFLVGIALLTAGTTGKITGYVTDSETGNPLPGANIVIEGSSMGAASNLKGYYAILNVSPGTYILKASMMGYEKVTVKNVVVKIDLTTEINIEMVPEVLDMEEVVVVAERPIVAQDVSNSQLNVESEKIESMPVTDVSEVISLQAGIENMQIRGGSQREATFIVDGFVQNDERSHQPYTVVGLNTVEEVKVQTGGFNAEYGNVRSGVINVVTKEGSRSQYSGAFMIRYQPAGKKHFGISPYSENSFFLRPYMDPEICYVGTDAWDSHTKKQYPSFQGWDAVSAQTITGDDDPENDMTPDAAKRLFEWQHRRHGVIEKPDYIADLAFGGPVPIISEQFGNLRFYASYRDLREMFLVPLSRESYDENMGRIKITSDITDDMKLTLTGKYGETHSASPYNWTTTPTGDVIRSDYSVANYASSSAEVLFVPAWYSPTAIYRTILGVKLNKVISSKTYYELRMQHNNNHYNTYRMSLRDTTKKYDIFPGPAQYLVDEAPYGYWGYEVGSIGDKIRLGGWMNLGRDKSNIATTNIRFDFVSQLNLHNEFKTGIDLIINNYDIKSFSSNPGMETWNREQIYEVAPYRFGAYVQDKLEYEGFIANIGVRLDYTDANREYYDLEPYDEFYKRGKGNQLEEEAPSEDTQPKWALSPRLGISHPITLNSKLYFNYGHFRTEPSSTYRFRIQRYYDGSVTSIGNPNLEQEKTVAYEVGYSHNLFNQILLNIAGYYRDVTNQIAWIDYQNIDASVRYSTPENNHYEDIRGFEITLDKRSGKWFSGFVNYTYMVNTYGYFGILEHYEDPNRQREYLKQNPYQERPKPRPYARANLDFHTPADFGPALMGVNPLGSWYLNVLATWKAGSYTTYNPDNILGYGVINNVQWVDNYMLDLRLTKNFHMDKFRVQFYVDVSNLLDTKFLSYSGFSNVYDYYDYMESLRFDWEEGVFKGNDRIGEYRDWDVPYDPLEELIPNPDNDPQIASQNEAIEDRNKERINKKSYIDMPNVRSVTFLNPREIKFGVKISF